MRRSPPTIGRMSEVLIREAAATDLLVMWLDLRADKGREPAVC